MVERSSHLLDHILGAKSKVAALRVLFNSKVGFSGSTVAKRAGMGLLAIQNALADLERLVRSAAAGPRVEVTVSGDLEALPAAIDAAVFRIAQEAVTNALRHARHATLVDVRVSADRSSVTLVVRDDGDPTTADPKAGFGLTGMVERAILLGGTCQAGPSPGRGWSVTASLPRQVTA